MKSVLKDIEDAFVNDNKLLAVLIDPDKFDLLNVFQFLHKIKQTIVTHIFVGGSIVNEDVTHQLVSALKKETNLPIVLFPGDVGQITDKADAILYLALISGRNPKYLIETQVESVPVLEKSDLEIIPTGYILIESGKETAVARVTKTEPLSGKEIISQTAKAGEFLGMKLIYLEAGSGAKYPVSEEIIIETKNRINTPLIVGGGIRTKEALNNAYKAGADLVVIGTAFETDEEFYKIILK